MIKVYLSQLILNPASRMVQNECRNSYEMHRTLMHGFAGKRENANVLYRLDINPYSGMMALLVQSTLEPNWQPLKQAGQGEYLLSPPQWKAVELDLANGRILQFRLTANPTVKKDGKRHPIREEDECRRWLQTIGEGCEGKKRESRGFKVLDMDVQPSHNQLGHIYRNEQSSHKLTLNIVQFNGYLQVIDRDKLLTAVQKGIGPARAFGCGLLSLAPG